MRAAFRQTLEPAGSLGVTVILPTGEERPVPVVSINLPAEVFSALRRSPEEFAQEMRLAAAIRWYNRGEISQEKAAAIAGLDRADFLAALARERVDVFTVDLIGLKQEVERDG